MKIGSIHHQIQLLFKNSGIFAPGTSKHEAKTRARQKGITSSRGLGAEYMIYSYGTAEAYLAVWHLFGRYLKGTFGLRSIYEITLDHVRAYLMARLAQGVAFRTFQVHVAALLKLEKALRMVVPLFPSFGPAVVEVARMSRSLKKDHRPRAYPDPCALINAMAHGPSRLVARIQHEGGARVREATLIKEIQLRGKTVDNLTGIIKGKIHLIHAKGGLQRDLLVTLKTYEDLTKAVGNGVFRANPEVYRRWLVRAAQASNQDYNGTHGLRWNFAQRRFLTSRDAGMSEEQALEQVSTEMGHRRRAITLHYLLPTPY